MLFSTKRCSWPSLVVTCLILLSILLPGATLSAQEESEAGEAQITPYLVRTSGGEPLAAEWITLRVPENRQKAESKPIEIAFLRFPTAAPEPGPPIVVLPSDLEGASPLESVEKLLSYVAVFGAHSDVILMEPRGTGASRPSLACAGKLDLPDEPLDREIISQTVGLYVERCAGFWSDLGVDLAGYNVREMAADVEALRQALGYDQVALVGSGPGAQIGLTLLRDAPSSIDRAIFAHVEGPDQALKLPKDLEGQIEQIGARLAEDPVWASLLPSLPSTLYNVLARLEADPATVTVRDPDSGEPVAVNISASDARYALTQALTGGELAALPARIAALDQSDFRWLGEQVLAWRRGLAGDLTGTLAACAAGASAERRSLILQQVDLATLGDAANRPHIGVCDRLGSLDLGDAYRTLVESDVPVLLISGSLDGVTPPANAESVLAGLPNGQGVVVAGAAHDLFDHNLASIVSLLQNFMVGDPYAPLSSTALSVPFGLDPPPLQPVPLTGWQGEYFDNPDLQGEPVLTRSDVALDFNWAEGTPAPGVPADGFSARWTTVSSLPAGAYRLAVWADDGVRLWVDDVPVLDDWEAGSANSSVVDLNLARGDHSFRVEFFEESGSALLKVLLSQVTTFPNWRAEYYDNPNLAGEPVVVRNERRIEHDWGANPPVPGLPSNGFSARWTQQAEFEEGAYAFILEVEGGARLWFDGAPVIDSWTDSSPRRLRWESPTLRPGAHDLQVDYNKLTGNGRISVRWERTTIPDLVPTAVISATTRAQAGQPVRFDGSASTGAGDTAVNTYLWSFGNGNSGVGAVVDQVYTRDELYDVTLTVVDERSQRSSTTRQVLIGGSEPSPSLPEASITAPGFTLINQPVEVSAQNSAAENPIVTFDWRFGDGGHASTASAEHIYRRPGTYNITLSLTDDQGGQAETHKLIQVFPLPPSIPEPLVVQANPALSITAPLTVTVAVTAPLPPADLQTPLVPSVPVTAADTVQTQLPELPSPQATPGITQTVQQPQSPLTQTVSSVTTVPVPPTAVIRAIIDGVNADPVDQTATERILFAPLGKTVLFTGRESLPGSAPITNYEWRIDTGGGSISTSVGDNLQLPLAEQRIYQVTLLVTDQAGQQSQTTWIVQPQVQ